MLFCDFKICIRCECERECLSGYLFVIYGQENGWMQESQNWSSLRYNICNSYLDIEYDGLGVLYIYCIYCKDKQQLQGFCTQ